MSPAAKRSPDARPSGVALGLGIFGVALGAGELLAPRALARGIGARPGSLTSGVVRGLGVRELLVSAGLLTQRRTAPWLWARVAGDAVDLGLLVSTLRRERAARGRVWGALAAVAGVTAIDVMAAVGATRAGRVARTAPVKKAVTIARPREAVYGFWRDLRNLPSFMRDIESVEVLDDTRSRWTARGPVGPVVSWEAVIDDDQPGERLSWHAVEDADLRTEGVVTFQDAAGGRGTEVRLSLRYQPRDGAAGGAARFLWAAVAPLRIEADLLRSKQILEAGYVAHSDASVERGRHPARPSAPPDGAGERRP